MVLVAQYVPPLPLSLVLTRNVGLENPSSFGNIPALWTAAWGVFALVSLLGLIGGILEYRPLVVLYDSTLIVRGPSDACYAY